MSQCAPVVQQKDDPSAPAKPDQVGQILCINDAYLTNVSLSADGKTALGTAGLRIGLWNLETGELIRKFGDDKRASYDATFLPGEREALVARSDGNIEVVDLETGAVTRVFAEKYKGLTSLALSADGRLAFSGGVLDQFLRQWDVANGRELNRIKLTDDAYRFSISADGSLALVKDSRSGLAIWDVQRGAETRPLSVPQGNIVSFALSPDGKTAIFTSGKNVVIWDVDANCQHDSIEMSKQPIFVAFGRDARTALVGGNSPPWLKDKSGRNNGLFWFLDLEKRQIYEFQADMGEAHRLAFTPDMKRAVSIGFNDHTLRLWNLPSGR